jgi:heptosyltransferase-2
VIALRVCALGDLVLTGPLLAGLPDGFLVAHGEHVELARAAGWVRGGIDADLAGLHALYAGEPDAARLAPALRERLAAGEAVLVLGRPGTRREALLRGLARAGARELHAHDPLPPPGVHAADHLAAALGERAAEPAVPSIELADELRAEGRARLESLGRRPGARAIALHAGAGAPAKRWPVSHWVRLWSARVWDAQPFVVCGPADLEPSLELADRLRAPLLRDLPLLELAAALCACAALVGHDSGVSHLAAALGVPTLALFGPTDPAQWAPRGPCASWLRAPTGRLADLDPEALVLPW